MDDASLPLTDIVFKYETEVKEIAAMFPSLKLLAIAAALKHHQFDTMRTVDAILEDTEKWAKAADSPVTPPRSNPLKVSDGTRRWVEDMKRQQQLLWEQTEHERKRREEEAKGFQYALELKASQERRDRAAAEEEAKSMAAIAALMAEDDARKRQQDILNETNELLAKELLEKERLERERELEKKEYPCSICFSDFKIGEMYTLDECSHRFCLDCIRHHVEAKVKDGEVTNCRCPSAGCQHVMTYYEIGHTASRDTFRLYDNLLLNKTLDSDPNCRWCPRPGCGTAMIGNPLNPRLTCPNVKCNFAFCFNCKEAFHDGASCDEYQKWKVENSDADNKFFKWANANTKKCPKCSNRIEKNGGCNHMTCQHCRYEFCWTCGQDYKVHGTCG